MLLSSAHTVAHQLSDTTAVFSSAYERIQRARKSAPSLRPSSLIVFLSCQRYHMANQQLLIFFSLQDQFDCILDEHSSRQLQQALQVQIPPNLFGKTALEKEMSTIFILLGIFFCIDRIDILVDIISNQK